MCHHLPRMAACASSSHSHLALQADIISALRIQRCGCPWAQPRAGPEGRLVACANAPSLARRLPCGQCRPARSNAHAHVHSAWAYAALNFACGRGPGVASESAPRRTALLGCPFGLLVAPAPGMRHQARAVRRVLLRMRACMRRKL